MSFYLYFSSFTFIIYLVVAAVFPFPLSADLFFLFFVFFSQSLTHLLGGLINLHKLAVEYFPMLDPEALQGSGLHVPEIVQLPPVPDLKLRVCAIERGCY
jgi:hypothetical protein